MKGQDVKNSPGNCLSLWLCTEWEAVEGGCVWRWTAKEGDMHICLLLSFLFLKTTFRKLSVFPSSVWNTEIVYSVSHPSSGFGGLVVGTQDRGFAPDRSRLIFSGEKNPQHAFLRKGSKAACPMSQICDMSKNRLTYRGSRSYWLNYRLFLTRFRSSLTEDSSVVWHRELMEMTDGTKWRRTKGLLA
jgi:hypothetical protein